MGITYLTNWMGPVSRGWYDERGLDPDKELWYGGRIDIYGLDESQYYGGMSEYALPVMDGQSWELFSQWLENYETDDLRTYDQLIFGFESSTQHKIRWAPDVTIEV